VKKVIRILLNKLRLALDKCTAEKFGENQNGYEIIHGYRAKLNKGNRYVQIAREHKLFGACAVECVAHLYASYSRKINVLDVGAAYGDTVLMLEQRCPNMIESYLCIEGDEDFFELLKTNTAQFNSVVAVHALLASECKEVPTLIRHHEGTASCAGELKVQAAKLDNILRGKDFLPDLVKIDVDGFELEILKGAKRLLSLEQPTLLVEWHPFLWERVNQDPTQLFKFLNQYGYESAIWFDNRGEFSHFSTTRDFDSIKNMRNYLLNTNDRRDQHFDIIFSADKYDKLFFDVAELRYATQAVENFPA